MGFLSSLLSSLNFDMPFGSTTDPTLYELIADNSNVPAQSISQSSPWFSFSSLPWFGDDTALDLDPELVYSESENIDIPVDIPEDDGDSVSTLYVAVPDPSSPRFRTFQVFSPTRVSGDTNSLRFTINFDTTEAPFDVFANDPMSSQTMYLCKTFVCSDDNGVAMESVFNSIGDGISQYLHLVPDFNTLDTENDGDDGAWMNHFDALGLGDLVDGWFEDDYTDYGFDDYEDYDDVMDDTDVNGLDWLMSELFGNETEIESLGSWESMEEMEEFEQYGDVEVDEAYVEYENMLETQRTVDGGLNVEVGDELVRVDEVDVRELADEDADEALAQEEEKDLLFTEMTAIIIFLIVCGVVYVGWRCLIDHRERKRELDYYQLSEQL